MKIIMAQGNPGAQYAQTRHNTGWQMLDMFARQLGTSFSYQAKFDAEIATSTYENEKLLLVKPRTFYNETGRTARKLTDFYKLTPSENLLLLHDDLALPLGMVRVRPTGSDGGNRGVKSLNAHLGGNYWRIRIGIWEEKREHLPDSNFVLGRLSAKDETVLKDEVFPYVSTQLKLFLTRQIKPDSFANKK